MKWFFTKDGVKEEVKLERWVWVAFYKDGSKLQQFAEDGVFHQVGEIDQGQLNIFTMCDPSNKAKPIHMVLPAGAKLVHLYRNYVLDMGGKKVRARVYIFGYKLEEKYSLYYIMPNNEVILSDNYDLPLSESIMKTL